MKLLDGKRALVIGGGGGIGQATAWLFADEGADVAIGDISEKGGQTTVKHVVERGKRSLFRRTDVTKKPDVEAVVRATVEQFGGIDILVVTPMTKGPMTLLTISEEEWDRQFDVMAKGTFFAFQAVIPVMQKQGAGVLLATSSGHFADFGPMTHGAIVPPYGSAKAAVELLVRTTARIHSSEGIRVNAVQPGFTMTEGAMTGMREYGFEDIGAIEAVLGDAMPMGALRPEEVAEGFVFLASDYASYVTGFSLGVEGGGLACASGKLLPA